MISPALLLLALQTAASPVSRAQIDQAIATEGAWRTCVMETAGRYGGSTDERADTIADAALTHCEPDQNSYQAVMRQIYWQVRGASTERVNVASLEDVHRVRAEIRELVIATTVEIRSRMARYRHR